jgi:uncharacterized damage-inducible protein DinB
MPGMTSQELQALVDYHYWATARMLAAVKPLGAEAFTRDLGSSFRSIRDTLSHMHSAEWLWAQRLQGESPAAALAHERFPDLASVRAGWAETEAGMRAFLAGLDDQSLQRVVEYRLLNGQPASSRVGHIVQHTVNHGTYHRGQIATMLRQLGAAPPQLMDLIVFYRQLDA